MRAFDTQRLPSGHDVIAPDGSEVRILLGLTGGGMAHFRLASGVTSQAVTHRTVEEIWYVIAGQGDMWRKADGQEEIVKLEPGVCLTIPLGTCLMRTAVSTLFTFCPPLPPERKVSVSSSVGLMTISSSSFNSETTSTLAKLV